MASAGTAYVDVEAKLDSFAQQIEAAVSNIESQAITLEVDTTEAEASVASVSDGQLSLFVEAETETAQAEVDAVDGGETEVKVKADTAEAQASVDDLAGSFGGLADAAGLGGGALGGVTEQLAGLTGASTATTAGIGAMVGGLVLSVGAAGEAEAVNAKLNAVLESTGAGAYVTQDAINSLASEVQGYSGQSDEAITSASTLLLTFSGLSNEAAINAGILDRATKATADIAALMGGDASGAALRLGRALDDPARGMSMLQRSGVSFTQSQKDTIQSLAESGDMLGAQAELLAVVESQVGGVAAAYGDTLPGQLDKTTEAVGDLAEVVGADLLPALSAAAEDTTLWVQTMTDAKDDISGLFGGLMGDVQGALLEGGLKSLPIIGPVVSAVDGLRGAFGGADSAGKALGDALGNKTNPALAETAEAADDAAYAVSHLDDRVQGYLDGVFRVPEAERALRESFAGLTDVLDDPARAADDVATNLQEIVTRAAELGLATGDMTGAVDAAVFGLAGLQAQGKLSAAEVASVTSELESLPGNTEGNVSLPGAVESENQAREVGNALLGIKDRTAYVGVSVNRAGFDQLVRDLEASEERRFRMQVSVDTVGTRARGGPVERGSEYLVGEEGPEMFVPRTSGTIIPAPQTASLMGGGGFSPTVNIYATGSNGDDIARAVSDELRKLERAGR